MDHPLFRVVSEEGERERERILAEGRHRAAEILRRAREEADRVRNREAPASAAPRGDPRLAERREAFLRRYQTKVEELRETVAAVLEEREPRWRHGAVAALVAEAVSRAEAGVYRLAAPQPVWDELSRSRRFSGRSLRWTPAPDGATVLTSEDGSFRVRCDLGRVIDRYLETQGSWVARTLVGDDAL